MNVHPESAQKNHFNGQWYSQLIDEKPSITSTTSTSAAVNNKNYDSWWESDFMFANESDSKVDSQGNIWKSENVTQHPEIKKPIALGPINPPPSYSKPTINSNYNSNYDNDSNSYNSNYNSNSNVPSLSKRPSAKLSKSTSQPTTLPSLIDIDDDFAKPSYSSYNNSNNNKNNKNMTSSSEYPSSLSSFSSYPSSSIPSASLSKSKPKERHSSRISRSLGDDEIGIRFKVPYAKFARGCPLYKERYPVILTGIVEKDDYLQVVKGLNEAVMTAVGKKRYSEGVAGFLGITACLILLPAIPLIILENKKIEKVQKAKQLYLDMINPQFAHRGIKWATTTGNMGWELVIEITDLSIMSPEMQMVWFQKGTNVHSWKE